MQYILLESNSLLCSPNVISRSFCTQTSDLSYPIPSLVSHLVPLSHPESVLKSLSLPVSAEQVKGWVQLLVTSLTCSLEPSSRKAAARAGHSENWGKFSRNRTAFNSPRADLGPAKLRWLRIGRKRACSHISSTLLSRWLGDSSRGGAQGENKEIKACFPTTATYTGIYYQLSGLTFNSKSSWDDRQPHVGWLYLACRLDTKSKPQCKEKVKFFTAAIPVFFNMSKTAQHPSPCSRMGLKYLGWNFLKKSSLGQTQGIEHYFIPNSWNLAKL